MKQFPSIKIAGSAGQGVRTAGFVITKALKNLGYWTFSYSEYPSLIRGGHSTFQINTCKKKNHSVTKKFDVLVALNQNAVNLHYREIKKHGVLLCDDDLKITEAVKKELKKNKINLMLPTVDEIVKKNNGLPVMNNSVITGACWAILTDNYGSLEKQLRTIFAKKAKSIKTNLKCAKDGFSFVQEQNIERYNLKAQAATPEKVLGTGNEIAGMATYAAGCRLYSAYPMTPSTGILQYLINHAEKTEMVVKQAEDEITAIQIAIGASFAGTRSACGTSGGGLALMTESLSLIGMTETPLVVFNSQRPGPATGTPTWTEQGDLSFAVNAGHGDFPKVVISPGDIDEIFTLVPQAFNLADKYQTLVIILLDKYLSESWYQTRNLDDSKIQVQRGQLLSRVDLKKQSNFKRYKFTASGVSGRSFPGMKQGIFLANSDEHDEKGYSTENLKMRKLMMQKRMQKLSGIKNTIPEPKLHGNKDAKTTVICWGSQKGPVLDAISDINEHKTKVNVLHYSFMYPLKDDLLKKLAKTNRLIMVENNFSAQFATLIRQETGIDIKTKITKYDGTPFFRDELVQILNKKIR